MFRRFGIQLIDDAAWVGGLLVAMVILLAERRLPARAAVASNLAVLAGLSLVVMLVCALLDLGPWSVGLGRRMVDALHFFVAYAPLSICLAADWGSRGTERLLSLLVVLVSLLTGSMLATAFRSEATAFAWGAAGLSLLASASWASCREIRHK